MTPREYVRWLADEHADSPDIHQALVIATRHLDAAEREDAWAELLLNVNLLAELGNGLEWREVVPGAPPAEGYSIAADVLERDIDAALDRLVGRYSVMQDGVGFVMSA